MNASCGDCDGKEKQIGTLEDRIGKVVDERLKMQSRLKDVKKESDEKDAELERTKGVIAEQKREILKLKEEIQNLGEPDNFSCHMSTLKRYCKNLITSNN